MLDAFNRHPESVGETYGEHLAQAGTFGATMITFTFFGGTIVLK